MIRREEDEHNVTVQMSDLVIHPGEPCLQVSVNGKVLSFPLRWMRLVLFHMLPPFLRDSSAAPPEPSAEQAAVGFDKHTLIFFRSSIKNLIKPFLPRILRAYYGPQVQVPKGKDDVLPVICLTLLDFVLTQGYHHPLVIEYDEATGLVRAVRQGQRVAPPGSAGDAASAPSANGAGGAGHREE